MQLPSLESGGDRVQQLRQHILHLQTVVTDALGRYAGSTSTQQVPCTLMPEHSWAQAAAGVRAAGGPLVH